MDELLVRSHGCDSWSVWRQFQASSRRLAIAARSSLSATAFVRGLLGRLGSNKGKPNGRRSIRREYGDGSTFGTGGEPASIIGVSGQIHCGSERIEVSNPVRQIKFCQGNAFHGPSMASNRARITELACAWIPTRKTHGERFKNSAKESQLPTRGKFSAWHAVSARERIFPDINAFDQRGGTLDRRDHTESQKNRKWATIQVKRRNTARSLCKVARGKGSRHFQSHVLRRRRSLPTSRNYSAEVRQSNPIYHSKTLGKIDFSQFPRCEFGKFFRVKKARKLLGYLNSDRPNSGLSLLGKIRKFPIAHFACVPLICVTFKPCHSDSQRAREMKVAPKQRFLTKSDAARYAGRSLSTVNRWIKLGLPRINTPSGGVLVDRAVLDSWLKSNEVSAS